MSDKYYRLVTFIINICPKPLRELFVTKAKTDYTERNLHYTDLEQYLKSRKPDINELLRRSKITLDQFDYIFPSTGSPNIQIWDVTLLTTLLRGLFGNKLIQDERDCIDVITNIRNSLQHLANTECIVDKDFNSSWSALKDAVLTLLKYGGSPQQSSIEEEINSALTENMPNLGDVLRTWHKVLYVQLQLQNSELEKKLDFQATEIQTLKGESKTSSKILSKASVKRKGRTGVAEKRMRIVDNKVERMRAKIKRSLEKQNDCIESFKDDISLITQQLTDNHRVIVTGHDNTLTYKCALAVIQDRKYQRPDQCLEINNPSNWKRICSEDAQFVLFHEPFGRATYDSNKVEVMLEEFDSMIDATDDDNDDVIDIVIVTNQRLLNKVTRHHDHDMLSTSSMVYIDSSADDNPEDTCATEETVYRNLLEYSKVYHQSYTGKMVNKEVKDEAKKMFIEYSAVVIVGSAGSGKTSLSFKLLPAYDLSNGEENFLVIIDPGELKYVKCSLQPVIIMKPLAGMGFGKAEAWKWYRQFDRMFAAVQEKKVAVIITMETEVFQMWKANMPTHPLLDHVVYMAGTRAKEMEKHKQGNVQNGLQTEKTSHYDEIPNRAPRDVIRHVKSVRDYDIGSEGICNITGGCVLPTGHILLADFENKKITKMDRYYIICNTYDLPERSWDVCYIDSNVAVVALRFQKLQFVDISEDLTLTKSVNTDHECRAVACHGNKLYVIDFHSVYVYTTDGECQNVLYTADFDEDDDYDFNYVAVSNDGRMIYITYYNIGLVTIDSSGNHLYTLTDLPHTRVRGVCVDDQGYVYVLFHDFKDSLIVQVSTDGRQNLGTVFELDDVYESIQFDSMKSALLVTGISKKLRVLTLH
ncbi:uncharacterized protein LOC123531424 [Mercenaria mercenaria]|uniref:uncharacterized protein LOC123531424 n=1 Tax=Mercenaria mercenaria TaxID=6596 RepID=UPI00234EB811|nr:uncharacterized protein LOC123531424 [Mercenaria mercenaria]